MHTRAHERKTKLEREAVERGGEYASLRDRATVTRNLTGIERQSWRLADRGRGGLWGGGGGGGEERNIVAGRDGYEYVYLLSVPLFLC